MASLYFYRGATEWTFTSQLYVIETLVTALDENRVEFNKKSEVSNTVAFGSANADLVPCSFSK